MSDDLLYWKNALMGILGPIHENAPQCGWYRTRPKRGYASLPVRIWRDHEGTDLRALKAGRAIDPCEIWTWCCMNPVSEDAYKEALERGDQWPDGVPSSNKPPQSITPLTKASVIRLRQRGTPIGISDTSLQSSSGQRPESPDGKRGGKPQTSSEAAFQPNQNQSARYLPIGHNSAQLIVVRHQSIPEDLTEEPLSKDTHQKQEQSRLHIMLDPFADAREMSDHIALLWDDVSSWLKDNGPIVDQVQADRCANYASALSNLEALSEDMRVREKKPLLDECRSVDHKWKPVIDAAKNARQSCKKAIEPFLVSEWFRLKAISKKQQAAFHPPRAGSIGRAISIRHREKVVITKIHDLSYHYYCDERLLKNEAYRKILMQHAEDDLKAGKTIPGIKIFQERSVS